MEDKMILLAEKLTEKFGAEKMCAIIATLTTGDILRLISELGL